MSDYPPPPGAYPPPPPPPGPYQQPPSSAYAHWGQRVGAYLIDIVILLPAYVVAAIGAGINGASDSGGNALGTLLMLVGYLGAIAIAIWNLIFRQGRTGWSIGKKVLGIRLLEESTGRPLGPGKTFLRALLHIVDSLPCYIGYLWPLWDPKRQTFADKIIGSVVIPQQEGPAA